MEGSLRHFQFAQFQFLLKALDTINLPAYKGSTFRGAFGHAFKRVVCINKDKVCNSCLLKEKCVYSYVFETPPPSDTSKMRKYPFAPHPFVITPPLEEKRTYREEEMLCFDLTLIGKSIDFLPYFIYTFDELGRMGIGKGKGKYHLKEVKGERLETIYCGKEKILKNTYKILTIENFQPVSLLTSTSASTLKLIFLTPTRLKFDGRLSPSLEFHILFRNLLRRISLLSYFHCGKELDLDFKRLIEMSRGVKVQEEKLTWVDWERYSNRQETKMKMGGVIGSITFEGDLEPFLPFLLLGEYIHVGKGTSFGLGKYEIMRFSK